MAQESKLAVIGAVAANFAIAAVKLIAAIAGHSSAMLSEGIHSAVDGLNDSLLLFGMRQSKRPADAQHPFGYGKELYFWSLIVGMSVLALGGGATVWEGVMQIAEPKRIEHAQWAFAALGCGFLFDGISLVYGLRQFRQQNEGKGLREGIREAKDPSALMVIVEDSAAVAGEVVAAVGVWLNVRGLLWADGVASVLIGLLLGAVAVFLIAQTRDLVVGEAVVDETSDAICKLAVGDEKFVQVRRAHTMHFGPDTVLVTLDVTFNRDRTAGELMDAVDEIQQSIREKLPAVKFVYIDPESERKSEDEMRRERRST